MIDFNIVGYLVRHGHKYREDDNNYLIKECPSCGNQNYKFGISKKKNLVSHCFVCNVSMNIYQLVMLMDDVSYFDARNIIHKKIKRGLKLGEIKKVSYKKIQPEGYNYSNLEEMKYPLEFNKLNDHIPYTKKRGITREVLKKFDLHYANDGYWAKRLIIPVKHGGVVVGWQGRDVTGRADVKIKSTKGFSKSKFIINYDDLLDKKIGILCEGPFDVMHAAAVSDRVGAFGIMGKDISTEQVNLLLKTKLRKLYIGLDPDFPENVIKTARSLQQFFDVSILPIPQDKDLGEMTVAEIKKCIIHATEVPSKYRI